MIKGAVLYAKNLHNLTQFYLGLGGRKTDGDDGEFTVISGAGTEFVILQAPSAIASQIVIEDPPAMRADTPIKPIFEVGSIDDALKSLPEYGARPVPGAVPWTFKQFLVQDIIDPEGNVIQLWQAG